MKEFNINRSIINKFNDFDVIELAGKAIIFLGTGILATTLYIFRGINKRIDKIEKRVENLENNEKTLYRFIKEEQTKSGG